MSECAVGRSFTGLRRLAGLDWSGPCPYPGYATIVPSDDDGTALERHILCLAHFFALLDWVGDYYRAHPETPGPTVG